MKLSTLMLAGVIFKVNKKNLLALNSIPNSDIYITFTKFTSEFILKPSRAILKKKSTFQPFSLPKGG